MFWFPHGGSVHEYTAHQGNMCSRVTRQWRLLLL